MPVAISVLIVEDSEDDAGLIERHLRTVGYEPEALRVETRQEMERALRERDWDVVLLDCKLPQLSAEEALELCRESGKDLPVILISGKIGEENAVDLLKAGAHDFVSKGDMSRLGPAIGRELRTRAVHREKRLAEIALRRSEERFRRLVENARDVIFRVRVHPEFAVEFVNQSSKRYLGYAPEEFYSDPDLIVRVVHRDYRGIIERFLVQPPATKTPLLLRLVHRDGTDVWGEIQFVPVFDRSGRYIAIEGAIRDVTDRRRQQVELERRTKEAEAADDRAHLYLDILSHDIANILTPLPSYLQMILSDERLSPECRTFAEKAMFQAQRASKLIAQASKLSKAETRARAEFRDVDLVGLLKRAEQVVRQEFPEKRIAVSYDLDRYTECFSTTTGHVEDLVEEVFRNAVKHSKGDEATMEISVRPMGEGGPEPYWMVKIADHGPGIPDTQKKLLMAEGLESPDGAGRGIVSTLTMMSVMLKYAGGWMLIGDRVIGKQDQGTVVMIVLPQAKR